jgi:hypothetical protein
MKCDCAESCLICGRAGSAHGKDQECPIPAFDGWIERFVPSGCDCAAGRPKWTITSR